MRHAATSSLIAIILSALARACGKKEEAKTYLDKAKAALSAATDEARGNVVKFLDSVEKSLSQ